MAYTNIDDPSAYFHTQLYTSDSGNTQSITNNANAGNFKPDFIWAKSRADIGGYEISHDLVDSSRGRAASLHSDTAGAETTASQTNYDLISFDTNGFTTGAPENTNSLGGGAVGKVAWQWKANGGTTTNLSGNLASVAQVNTDAGFSIVTYTGGGGNGQSVNHGLGLTPEVVITKARNGTGDWYMYHKSLGTSNYIKLNTNAAQAGSSPYNAADPTSTAFFVSTDLVYVGQIAGQYVSYVFSPIQGYSKFGSYKGNGTGTSDGTFDGTFVYTGFKPAWVMVKRSSYSAGDGWTIWDNAREPRGTFGSGNYINNKLTANSAGAESGNVYDAVDFLSNGFKLRTGRAGTNASGSTYIYMAFAENPFVTSTGIPTTAR